MKINTTREKFENSSTDSAVIGELKAMYNSATKRDQIDNMLTVQQIADIVHLSTCTVSRGLRKAGIQRHRIVGDGQNGMRYMIKIEDVKKYIQIITGGES